VSRSGALCANFRVDKPLWSTVLFPVYVAIALWAGLWLRDERLRTILPLFRPVRPVEETPTPLPVDQATVEAAA